MFVVVHIHFLTLEWILQVTLINNLELYGINIQEFARECQHGVAASTSISSVPGKKSQQLLVQGNQVLFVGNLLIGISACCMQKWKLINLGFCVLKQGTVGEFPMSSEMKC
jgi:translation initiation factor 1 (eIF-1/SUI1)